MQSRAKMYKSSNTNKQGFRNNNNNNNNNNNIDTGDNHLETPSVANVLASPFSFTAPEPLIELEQTSLTRLEIVQVIITWLSKVGYISSAELLHEEATAQLRGEYYARKTMRSLCRAIEERNWDMAQKNLRKLQTADVLNNSKGNEGIRDNSKDVDVSSDSNNNNCVTSVQQWQHAWEQEQQHSNAQNMVAALTSLVQSLPFLIAEQQFLELVDEDSGQQAYTFFMRNVKLFESAIAAEHFNRLTYLLTCRSVMEASVKYEEYRGWTPQSGRLRLISIIQQVENSDLMREYCKQGELPELSHELAPLPSTMLEQIFEKAISFDLLCQPERLKQFHMYARSETEEQNSEQQEQAHNHSFPKKYVENTNHTSNELLTNILAKSMRVNSSSKCAKLRLMSLFRPITEQLPPVQPYILIDINRVVEDYLVNANRPLSEDIAENYRHEENVRRLIRVASVNRNDWRVKLTACDFVPDANAVVVAIEGGVVLWIPLNQEGNKHNEPHNHATSNNSNSSNTTNQSDNGNWHNKLHVIHLHKQTVKGLRRHKNQLLCWGGAQATIIDLITLAKQEIHTSINNNKNNDIVNVDQNIITRKSVHVITHTFVHNTDVYCGCFFPSGHAVLTGLSQGTVCIWDTLRCNKISENTFTTSAIVSAVVNASGTSYFAAAKEGVIRVIDVATGVIIFSLTAPLSLELSSITLSHSSTYLLVAYKGGFIRIWDVVSGVLLPCRLFGAENNSRTSIPISFGVVDEFVFSGGEDGSIEFWNMRRSSYNNDCNYNNNLQFEQTINKNTRNANLTLTNSFFTQAMQKATKYPSMRIPLHKGSINDIKVFTDKLISCGEDGFLYICVGQF